MGKVLDMVEFRAEKQGRLPKILRSFAECGCDSGTSQDMWDVAHIAEGFAAWIIRG